MNEDNNLLQQQLDREKIWKESAIQKYINTFIASQEQGRFNDTPEGQALMRLGFDKAVATYEEYLNKELKGHSKKLQEYIKMFTTDPSVLAYVVLSAVIKRGIDKQIKMQEITRDIGRNLQTIALYNRVKEDDPKLLSYLGTEFKRARPAMRSRMIKRHYEHLYDLSYDKEETAYRNVTYRAGALLVDTLIRSGANIIRRCIFPRRGKPMYGIVGTDEAQQVILNLQQDALSRLVKIQSKPLLIPPRDWKGVFNGGYYSYKYPLVKMATRKITKKLKHHDYSKIYPIVNKLHKTPFRINKTVYKVIQEVIKYKIVDHSSAFLVPKLIGDLPYPDKLELMDYIDPKDYGADEKGYIHNKEKFYEYDRKRDEIVVAIDREVGRRYQLMLAMSVAEEMLDIERFYYTYQLDYRGRVYTHINYLNPQHTSYIKALLEFADGEVLNERGVYWYKIHIANLYGLDKAPLEERVRWVDTHEADIIRVGTDPMNNIKLWAYTDSPYEFLAACVGYVDYKEGRPVHVPIALDATCSGIQVYSSILKDKEGAKAVNVIGSNREDIYQVIADKANELLENGDFPKEIKFKDKEGTERLVSTIVEAESLKGNITRSLVKRPVMTTPYSVTLRGISEQLWDTMDSLRHANKQFWTGDSWVVNKLLVYTIKKAIDEIVVGAKIGQEYFKECVRDLDTPAEWVTPIYNFKVIQPKFKVVGKRIQTIIGKLSFATITDEVAKQQQINSIAPNIIHSLDSTILYGVVERVNCDISVVHDSFSVLANYGDELQYAYKDSLVALIEQNPLEYIGKQLNPDVPVPRLGNLNLNDIYSSKYIIS